MQSHKLVVLLSALGLPAAAAAQEQAPAPVVAQAEWGAVSGQVVDGKSLGPIRNAYVGAEGLPYSTTTDDSGRFTLALPPGSYKLEVALDLYEVKRVELTLSAREQRRFTAPIRLYVESRAQAEVTVIREPDRNSTEAVNTQRKNAAIVSDRISAEEIKKSADQSASQAAARVVGATVVGDRFVYVRGLGERYANSLFNGSPLPSPEPDQQAVPFDIFPTSLLANLTIAKTATPDMPGDFAGGSVQINTREFPTKLTASVNLGTGYNLSAGLRPYYSYPGGSADFLGIDDGTRALPGNLPKGLRGPQGPLSPMEVAGLAKQFRNVWTPQLTTGSLDYSLSASIGNQAKFGTRRLGYLFSLSYAATHQNRDPELGIYVLDNDRLEARTELTGKQSVTEVLWGALGSLVFSPSTGHTLSLSAIFTQSSDDEGRLLSGFSRENATTMSTTRLRFVSRSLGFVQLGGNHFFDKTAKKLQAGELEWRATYAIAARSEPDNHETYYQLDHSDGQYKFWKNNSNGQRFFSDNLEHQGSAGIDYTQNFKQWGGHAARFKLGAAVRYRFREFSARRFNFLSFGTLQDGTLINAWTPEQLFAPENFLGVPNQGVYMDEFTLASDTYTGRMGVYAAYGMVDLPLSKNTKLVLGARFEAAQQSIDSLDSNGQPAPARLSNNDVLPSLNFVYRVRADMNLRASASMTVARPEFRELARFQFVDYFGGELVRGNPDLTRTRIANADVRWEWFTGASDVLAVSAFFKYFDQPIEPRIQPGGNLIRTFANAPEAIVAGVELEVRKELSFLSSELRGVTMGGNFSYIYSRVDLTGVGGVQTSSVRPLAGQSPYVVNAFAEYEVPDSGFSIRVQYNVFGSRLDQVAALGLQDRYQQPRHLLDVSASQRLGKSGFSLRLAGRNLIDSPVLVTQEDPTTKEQKVAMRYQTGRIVNLALSYSY